MRPRWTRKHAEIMERLAGKWHDNEIAAWILGETADKFSVRTIRRMRQLRGLKPCQRNDWTAPLSAARRKDAARIPDARCPGVDLALGKEPDADVARGPDVAVDKRGATGCRRRENP